MWMKESAYQPRGSDAHNCQLLSFKAIKELLAKLSWSSGNPRPPSSSRDSLRKSVVTKTRAQLLSSTDYRHEPKYSVAERDFLFHRPRIWLAPVCLQLPTTLPFPGWKTAQEQHGVHFTTTHFWPAGSCFYSTPITALRRLLILWLFWWGESIGTELMPRWNLCKHQTFLLPVLPLTFPFIPFPERIPGSFFTTCPAVPSVLSSQKHQHHACNPVSCHISFFSV